MSTLNSMEDIDSGAKNKLSKEYLREEFDFKILDHVVGPFKDCKLDKHGNSVDWQEYYEVNGLRVLAEVYERNRSTRIAQLPKMIVEELRNCASKILT